MTRPKDDFDPRLAELLGAYLDGELSPSDRAAVERRLADDHAARRLLAELKEAALAVRALPRLSAPPVLAAEVLAQLERDALLAEGDAPSLQAGRKHLRLRRLLAAAAILILAGAVALIVYTVLVGPPSLSHLGRPRRLAQTAAPLPAPAPDLVAAGAAEPPALAPLAKPPLAAPPYGCVHVVLDADSFAAAAPLADLLRRHAPAGLVRTGLDPYTLQYACVLRLDDLRSLLRDIHAARLGSLGLLLAQGDERPLLVRDAPESLVLAVAELPAAGERLAAALDPSPLRQAEPVTTSQVPDWLAAAVARGQPEFRNLHLLGPRDLSSPAAPDLAPPSLPAQPQPPDADLAALVLTLRAPQSPLAEPNSPAPAPAL